MGVTRHYPKWLEDDSKYDLEELDHQISMRTIELMHLRSKRRRL